MNNTIEFKKSLAVYCVDNYIFYELPHDENFIKNEGIAMNHCLAYDYCNYCRRMKNKEIAVYSMTNVLSNTPVVDIEVALTKSSYGGTVDSPTVSQIRGVANECPPKDEYLIPLMKFFKEYGYKHNWQLVHKIKNFDSQIDGILTTERYNLLLGIIRV